MAKSSNDKWMDDSTEFNLKQVKKSASSQSESNGFESTCAKTEKAVRKIMTQGYGDR